MTQKRVVVLVEVTGLEPMASWSRTKRATNCATPRSASYFISVFSFWHIQGILSVGSVPLPRFARKTRSCEFVYKRHTVSICLTSNSNCATPRSVSYFVSVFSFSTSKAYYQLVAFRFRASPEKLGLASLLTNDTPCLFA